MMMPLNIHELLGLFESDQVVTDPAVLASYSTDYSGIQGGTPSALVYVTSHDDIQRLVRWANQSDTSLVSRGGGSNTTGAAVPDSGSVVVAFDRMNRIVAFDPVSHTICVEPGLNTQALKQFVVQHGYCYPPDPGGMDRSTIGGNVATNAGGPNAFRYGVTGDYVIGLEGVFGNGNSFKFGGQVLKNVAGYDVMRLLIGSEGTLGIFSRITLKLIPYLPFRCDIQVGVASVNDALRLIQTLRSLVPLSGMEFFDATCAKHALSFLGETDVFQKELPPYTVILSVEGCSQSGLDADVQIVMDVVSKYKIQHELDWVSVASDEKDRARLWAIRRAISPALKQGFCHKQSHDVVVPLARLAELMAFLPTLSTSAVTVLGYGHLGDGNVHVNILGTQRDSAWEQIQHEISLRLLTYVVSLGGSISGEHGIGRSKRRYLSLMFEEETLEVFCSLKRIFDPLGVLNSGALREFRLTPGEFPANAGGVSG